MKVFNTKINYKTKRFEAFKEEKHGKRSADSPYYCITRSVINPFLKGLSSISDEMVSRFTPLKANA